MSVSESESLQLAGIAVGVVYGSVAGVGILFFVFLKTESYELVGVTLSPGVGAFQLYFLESESESESYQTTEVGVGVLFSPGVGVGVFKKPNFK